MASLRVPEAIPDAYRVESSPEGLLAVRLDREEALREAGFSLESDGRAVPSQLAGRRPLAELQCGDEVFVLRAFTHGGLARWLTGARFRDPQRPFVELVLSEHLRSAGVLTPTVVAARARRARLLGWSLTLVTRRVEGAEDLGRRLARIRSAALEGSGLGMAARERVELRPWIERTARTVRAMHDAGLDHADLNPHNLLLRDASARSDAQVWVLDLDRSKLVAPLPERSRCANLRRLYRHVRRRDEAGAAAITLTDCVRFLRAYGAPGECWRERFRSIAASHARGSAAHRFGWALERAVRR